MVMVRHVNFDTWRGIAVFDNAEYDAWLRCCLPATLAFYGVACPVWEIMPTRVHLIVAEFADLPLSLIMKRLKGDTARLFFTVFPELRRDLDGHLWRKGYFSVAVASHRHVLATAEYIRANRRTANLVPASPVAPTDSEG